MTTTIYTYSQKRAKERERERERERGLKLIVCKMVQALVSCLKVDKLLT